MLNHFLKPMCVVALEFNTQYNTETLDMTASSSYSCHGVGPLVDTFRSHVSRSLFKGLPVGE